jgi:hypothetical protein
MSGSYDNMRLVELLIDRATVGLSVDETLELETLLAETGTGDDFSFDYVVHMLERGEVAKHASDHVAPMNALPDHIRASIVDDASHYISQPASDQPDSDQHDSEPDSSFERARVERAKVPAKFAKREFLAWFVAAACLVFALFAWIRQPDPQIIDKVVKVPSSNDLIARVEPSEFETFLKNSEETDLLKVEMDAGGHDSGKEAKGTVYWNRQAKKGFVKFENLAINDANQQQYQLWVIDRKRGFEDRPNAGVFDIKTRGENIFEFRSDLEVFDAMGFAVTVENPGGVNKSDLSKIALLNAGS